MLPKDTAPVKARRQSKIDAAKAKNSRPQFELINDPFDGEVVRIIPDSDLAHLILRGLSYSTSSYTLRNMNSQYGFNWLVSQAEALSAMLGKLGNDLTEEPLASFLQLLSDRAEEMRAEAEARIATGNVIFDDLRTIFAKGTEIIVGEGDDAIGGVVVSAEVQRSWMGTFLSIAFRAIANTDGRNKTVKETTAIRQFFGTMKIDTGHVRRITPAEKAALAERGAAFREFSGVCYSSYTGVIRQPSWGGDRMFRSDGRVMVDALALKSAAPNLFNSLQADTDFEEEESLPVTDTVIGVESDGTISDENLWMCGTFLLGFSFACKKWGKLSVNGLRQISWRTDAFDKLVLPQEDKEVVRALVEHSQGAFTDIIDGKGGGTIFLLHGVPGQGKTLLAETTAEMLQRPLYTISVGELGISPDELEERLRAILDLATAWNAVLLLDEADIFLEERNESDIVRNAMVGVFLRLLEYHQGTLFLTTNRVKNIDSAFFSRISVAFKFEDADEDKLAAIWTNLLDSANIQGLDSRLLAQKHGHLNGRQIKNSIRLAQTLAKAQSVELSMTHIERTIELGSRFTQEFSKA